MKIDPNRNDALSRVGKKKTAAKTGSGSSSFASELENSAQTENSADTAAASAPLATNPLFSLQDVGDATADEKRRARLAGTSLLDQLDDIRLALVLGGLSQSQLLRLEQQVKSQKHNFTDPRLREILMDIELRARVELAKFGI